MDFHKRIYKMRVGYLTGVTSGSIRIYRRRARHLQEQWPPRVHPRSHGGYFSAHKKRVERKAAKISGLLTVVGRR